MKKCKLYQNISLANYSGDGCIIDINVGIADGLYVYNLDDIDGLVFEDDARADGSLFIETINTSQPYYRIDATNITYVEEYGDHNYSHELTATITSVRTEIEEILQDAVHGRYVVAFRVVGEEYYKFIGWKEGLSLDEVLNIGTDNNSYTLTFDGVTTFPHMAADKDNFNLEEKVFEPIFVPSREPRDTVCDDGWAVAMYAEKVNAAGQSLDEDDKLTMYSGKKQDAYKLEGASDGDYNIVGIYDEDATFNGDNVKIFDPDLCEEECFISASTTEISFDSSTLMSSFTLVSSGEWEVVNPPSTVTLSLLVGSAGNTFLAVYNEGICGDETIVFKNDRGGCTAEVQISNSFIKIADTFYYPNGTTTMTLQPITCCNYTASSSEGSVMVNDDGTFTVSNILEQEEEKTVTVTLQCGTEVKNVSLVIYGIDTARGRKAISEWCEIE